jgi:hypothetical protein
MKTLIRKALTSDVGVLIDLSRTVSVFGISMLVGRRFPSWLSWLGLLGGFVTLGAGIAQAYTGFSALAMMLSMPGGFVLLLWAIVVGVFLWRLAPALSETNGAV